MNIKKMILAIVLIITMTVPQVVLAAPGDATEAKTTEVVSSLFQARTTKKGWVTENKKIRYYTDNKTYVKKAWKLIGKRWYYFDKKGYVMSGWQKINGQIYYLKNIGGAGVRGRMFTGWAKIGKYNYYFDKSGALATGWKQLGGKWYFFRKAVTPGVAGRTMTGWRKISGKVYYLSKAKGLKKNGAMFTGWKKISGNYYRFDSSGALQTGWIQIGSSWYYSEPKGAYGVLGRRVVGWRTISGKRYYMDKNNGKMLTGWQVIDGKDCFFNSSGVYEPNKEKTMKLIAIDAGHQAKGDPTLEPIGPGSSQKKPKVASGTYGPWSKLNEYELTLTVSKKLQVELEKRGYKVYMIRTTHNVNISNSQRAKNAANAGADILVRIHANGDKSSSVYGALTMAPGSNNPFLTAKNISESQRLSRDIITAYCKAAPFVNRGVQNHNDMSGINWSTIPVTIVEMGFMSNKTDDLNMATPNCQDMMVKGIANGIDQYFK